MYSIAMNDDIILIILKNNLEIINEILSINKFCYVNCSPISDLFKHLRSEKGILVR